MTVKCVTLVAETISNKPNAAGTFTLSGADPAVDGARTVTSQYADTNQLIGRVQNEDASMFEEATYQFTATGTTLARVEVTQSSNSDAAVDFSASATALTFTTDLTAGKAQFLLNSSLQIKNETITTANITGEVGKLHICDCSGLTANRDFVLPASANVGDRVGVYITSKVAAYYLVLKPDAADTINSGAAGAAWDGNLNINELVVFRCITANSAWIVEEDGRKGIKGLNRVFVGNAGGTTQPIAYATNVKLAAVLNYVKLDEAGYWDSTNKRITNMKAGKYLVFGRARLSDAQTGTAFTLTILKNGLGQFEGPIAAGVNSVATTVFGIVSIEASTDYIELYAYQFNGTNSTKNTLGDEFACNMFCCYYGD